MRSLYRTLAFLLLCGALSLAPAQTGRAVVSGFDTTRDVANDDGTYTAPAGCTAADDGGVCPGTKIDLGFTVNFFGLSFTQLYINTNGNVTFDSPLPSYTPFNLTSTNRQIIAPFFADVDTRGPNSGTVTFGKGTFGGRAAFAVNWINVGYYFQRSDKKNTFQLILVDRSDTGAGNFDIVFNYDSIQWETGEAPSSGGQNGLGGRSARAGYSNGTGASGTALELRGSSIPGSFLDSNSATGLIHGSLNSDVQGRYIFFARNGQIISGGLGITGPCPLPGGFQGIAYTPFTVAVSGGTPPYTMNAVLPPGLTFDQATLTVRGTPAASGTFPITVSVTDSAPGVLQQTREFTCSISIAAAVPPLKIAGTCATAAQNRPYWTQLAITGGNSNYSVVYNGPSWLAPAPSAPTPGVFTYSLAGTPPWPGIYPVSVTVKDTVGGSSTFDCSISVVPRMTITSACPTSPIRADSPFTYDLAAIGGTGTSAWRIVRGQLPTGLTLSSTGRIFGTPSGNPPFATFTLGVYSGDVSDEKTCSLAISPPLLRVTSVCPGSGAVGTSYGPYPVSAAGGLDISTYRFALTGNVPEGLLIANNSAIVGTPRSAGTYTFNVQVTSGDQTAASAPCTVVIGPAPIDLLGSCPAPVQYAGVPVGAVFSAAGGRPPYNYVLSGPAWLSQAEGSVAGTPPAGSEGTSVTFTIAAGDTSGSANSRTCTFRVDPAPATPVIVAVCPTGTLSTGSALSIPLAVAGGQPPYSWSYNNGIPGVSLASGAGVQNLLRGTLDQAGAFGLAVNVVDSAGIQAAPFTCSLTAAGAASTSLRLLPGSIPVDLLAPVPVTVNLPQPASAEINGVVEVHFTSAAVLPGDNPEVTLTNGYEVPFRIPAGATSVSLGNIQRGTVAGTILLRVVNLQGAGGAVPPLEIPVARAAPVFTASLAEVSNGIEVVLKGYSTTRDITGGRILLTRRSGSAAETVEVDLAGVELARLFSEYYAKSRTGAFDNVRISVPLEGGIAAVESITVELTNSAGTSGFTLVR